MNKFIVLILLGLLLYGLYRYHQQNLSKVDNKDNKNKKPKKLIKVSEKHTNNIKKNIKSPSQEYDDVSTSNISQVSIGSIDESNFKQDSMLDSLNSKDSLSFLDNKSIASNQSFFFK